MAPCLRHSEMKWHEHTDQNGTFFRVALKLSRCNTVFLFLTSQSTKCNRQQPLTAFKGSRYLRMGGTMTKLKHYQRGRGFSFLELMEEIHTFGELEYIWKQWERRALLLGEAGCVTRQKIKFLLRKTKSFQGNHCIVSHEVGMRGFMLVFFPSSIVTVKPAY